MIKIQKNIPLAPYTNYNIGGPAKYFCETSNKEEIIEVLNFMHKKNVPVFILGGGTNILVNDEGFSGLVVKLTKGETGKIREIRGEDEEETSLSSSPSVFSSDEGGDNSKIIVSAGTLLSDVVSFALKNGLQGLEWAAGIPGTVGGAIRGNAGAFGSCMADVVENIKDIMIKTSFNNNDNATKSQISKCKLQINNKFQISKQQLRKTDYKLRELSNENLEFGYRTSVVKEKGDIIILEAILSLKKIKNEEEKRKSKELVNYYLKYRKEHQPLNYPSCGSVFKNGEIRGIREIREIGGIKGGRIVAGVLIREAGLVGKKIGGAQISEKHCNFIINLGNASAKGVLGLIKLCQKEVYKKFGVKLKPEVEFVGF